MKKGDIGVDISQHNSYIDFNKLKNDGCKYVILRIGWIGNKNNHTLDTYFEDYYKRAKSVGLPVGIYVYNYCRSIVAIDSGCQWINKHLEGKQIDLPIFLDQEDSTIIDIGKDTLTRECEYFCNYFEKRGYKAGVYANKNWFTNYLDINRILNYKIWLAEWNSKITFKYKVDLWQYTSNGYFEGISGRVDTNKIMCDCDSYPPPVYNPVEGVFVDMKTFKNNGNYKSLVFNDSNCTATIGWLNRDELCDCIGIFENGKNERVVGIIYTIDNSKPANRKIGFTKLANGEVI